LYILAQKLTENSQWVFYQFEIDINGEIFINEKGKLKQETIIIYGYCSFNKVTEDFILDKERSHPYFTDEGREVIKFHVALIRKKRENAAYPPKIEIITGG
jgi:hypothetical protein